MASSSADICAVLAAVAAVCQKSLSQQDIGRLAASIEPTDGVFCQGMAMIQPETGAIWHVFPEVPSLAIAVFDVGGTVDTVAFHRVHRDRIRPASLTDRHLGMAASLSALANQPWLPKPDFTAFLQAALDHPAVVGVNVAHSGTVAGVFFGCEASPASREAVIDTLCQQFPQWSYRETVQLQPGGIFTEIR